jgi:hypothetical protein
MPALTSSALAISHAHLAYTQSTVARVTLRPLVSWHSLDRRMNWLLSISSYRVLLPKEQYFTNMLYKSAPECRIWLSYSPGSVSATGQAAATLSDCTYAILVHAIGTLAAAVQLMTGVNITCMIAKG